MENIWFVSDTHGWHESILKFCRETRDGDTAEEMTEIMIQNWNKSVKPNDRVYHCGDFSFGGKAKVENFASRLNGNIHLILGNHDFMIKKSAELQKYFASVQESKHIKVGDNRFIMTHTPQAEWWDCHRGVYHLFGHLHGAETNIQHQLKYRVMDVGIDTRSDKLMIPYHIDEVLDKLKDRGIMSHH